MKCIGVNKKIKKAAGLLVLSVFLLSGCKGAETDEPVTQFEKANYEKDLYRSSLFADTLCVAASDIGNEQVAGDASLHGAALFDVSGTQVLYSYRAHDRLFPASTTKILTALLAIERGNLDDAVTVSENAVTIPWDSSRAWLKAGDTLTLKDLLYGLMLPSGNDAAIAIAEHISGSVDAFAALMNEKARSLGATNSHFVNPNGLESPEHYTTAYDLYLIFNECIKHQEFIDIIQTPEYTARITSADGSAREGTWSQTNYYAAGKAVAPAQVSVIGGKTGTTDEAGSCLILYSMNQSGKPYISIVMGAADKPSLYQDMTSILGAVPAA